MLKISRLPMRLIAVVVLSLALPMLGQMKASGQSATLLPDGRVLLLGGFDGHGLPVADAFIASDRDGRTSKALLPSHLIVPRAGQSATVLPDGTVLVFGGVGRNGRIISQAELFDPTTATFSAISVPAVARAFHTATLLTDGSLVLIGGVNANGQFPDDVQLWNFRTKKVISQHAALSIPREGHVATLSANGTIHISGGTDQFGRAAQADEIFDPVTETFRFAAHFESSPGSPGIAESIPQDGAEDAPIEYPIAIRFSTLVMANTVKGSTVTLLGPDQIPVESNLTVAEGGRLAFVTPEHPLQAGTTYVLRIHGVADQNGSQFPEVTITFQTGGAPPDPSGLDWVPNSTWTFGGGTSKFQELPPLQAPQGTTALAGQVLKLNGWPLEHVTLQIDARTAESDGTGRFLLRGLTPGHHVLRINGATANRAGAAYGVYEVGVDLVAGKTIALNYTIWMTRLDVAHAWSIPSPTVSETVITNPFLPGLELRLPPGTVITDNKGKAVHQISITAIPLDKPPFPLPAGVQVPIYFTIQPGGAYIHVPSSGDQAIGARLIYPNAFDFPPGTSFDFWNYDPDVKGWYVYGRGKVSTDRLSVVPDPGVVIYEFTGAMVASPGDAKAVGPVAGQRLQVGDPIDLSTGQFVYSKTDLAVPDLIPINLTRTYTTNDNISRSFGIGAMAAYDMFMVGDISPFTYQELILPDGARVRFDSIDPGNSTGPYIATSSNTQFYGATLVYNDPHCGGCWTMTLKDGTVYTFPMSAGSTTPACQAVLSIQDRYANKLSITRGNHCQLTNITSPNGRYINFVTDAQQRITQATDNIGRSVLYSYDGAGRLSTVTDAGGGVTTFTYDSQNRMLTIEDARNIVYLTNQYDSLGRVSQQTQVDTGTYVFNWTTANTSQTHFYLNTGSGGASGVLVKNGCWGANGFDRYDSNCLEGYTPLVSQVDVTDPRGYIRRVIFNSTGYVASDTQALGQPEEQTATYTYYSDNLVSSVTDSLGRTTSYDYDRDGNVKRITRLDGTPDAVTTGITYGAFDQVASITDPLTHITTFGHDSQGNLTSITDPLQHTIVSMGYNGFGQLASVTDPLNNTIQFGYFGADLTSITDPVGNSTAQFFDYAGRLLQATDAQGNLTQYQYNNLNLVTQVTDAQGDPTTFSYDPNGNLLSLTDANQHTTNWTYDNMDRVQTRTDPLLRGESFSYDLMGNLVSSTDRKGQVTSLSYDPLNRLTLAGYNTVVNGGVTSYESTTAYTYDAGNRMTQAVDSAGGTITDAYDDLDRLSSETTPQGSISYGYDLAGRRTSMTVAGQPQVSYAYDNANRLTQIAQGTSTVSFGYDNDNRRATLTLSNGVNVAYSYDTDSRVTGITYNFGANLLGNLTYSYDSLGRRTQVGGSFARTGFPAAVVSASYDAANELTNWNGTPISYDLNGNMQSDGTNTFTWNARNQVATLNGRNLQYDAYGRRIQNQLGTAFLYDGANAAQELTAGTPTANLLSGGIDEMFSRTDSSGAFTPLQDALGSTIALVDGSGNLATQYSYDPFGNTTTSGLVSSNPSQYTGRENEGNGLYFYRARYYSPLLGRFTTEDPAKDGPNYYAYAADDPINFRDPLGLASTGTLPDTSTLDEELAELIKEMERIGVEEQGASRAGFCLRFPWVCGAGLVFVDMNSGNNPRKLHCADVIDPSCPNQQQWPQPRHTPSLAGRYTGTRRPDKPIGGGDDDDDDCNRQWRNAADYCSQIDDLPRNSREFKKMRKLFGRNILECMEGQVEERCGGHKIW